MNKILVGNNCHEVARKVVSFNEAKEFADGMGISYFEASAKNSTNVEEMFMQLAQDIYKRVTSQQQNTSSTTSISSSKKQKSTKELEKEKEKKQIEMRAAEIEKLLKSLGMNFSQIPDSLLSNDFQIFTFLNQLLKGKQNIRKQTIMIVGEGT